MKLTYTHDELLADPEYAERIRRGKILFHGGLDRAGRYLPPRSRWRKQAIEAWTERLRQGGLPTEVMSFDDLTFDFFPNVAQAKLLLRSGAHGAMTRILTLIGITEGFGNDGLKALPWIDFQSFFEESIEGTCLAHLHQGLLEAHGNDEAGRGEEAGHDVMWYEIRDAALDHPEITPDMYENLPIAPPPGYTGPAKPAAEAMSPADIVARLFPNLDPLVEIELSVFAQVLSIEIIAYSTFVWAREVLADPACSSAPQFAPWMVDCIQEDENLHVAYLQCALAEARARTFRDLDGGRLPGTEVVDAVAARILKTQKSGRRDRMLKYRMKQIRNELAAMPGGEKVLDEFARLGPVPA